MFQDFDISPGKFLIQMLIVLSLAIPATVRVLRRWTKGTMVIAGCFVLAACAGPEPNKRVFTGTYRWGDDPNNAQYLCLSADGSYALTEQSSMAVGREVKPFSVLHSTGQWKVSRGRVILEASDKTYFPTGRLILLVVERKSAESELLPVMGAGWTPERGYVRQ